MSDQFGDVKKLQAEIESMVFRKQALISTVQKEIQAAQEKINTEVFQVGEKVCESHFEGMEASDNLITHFDIIESLKNSVAEKEAKITDITDRYDEEIGMLQTHLDTLQPEIQSSQQTNNISESNGGAFCEKCGKPYTHGEDAFCMTCGSKLV